MAEFNGSLPVVVDVPQSRCGDPAYASTREWLITNGTGSYASGTIDGALTRRYHGLLVAALTPPAGRRLLVAKIDDMAFAFGDAFPLTRDRWRGDSGPMPLAALSNFRLEGTIPVWTFALGPALLERRIVMARGRDATIVRYTLVRSSEPVRVEAKAIVADRDFHGNERVSDGYWIDAPVERAVRVRASWSMDRATWIRCTAGEIAAEHTWYHDYELPWEAARGLDPGEDHLHAATVTFTLEPGQSAEVQCSVGHAEALADLEPDAVSARDRYDRSLLTDWRVTHPAAAVSAPESIRALVLAADAFVAKRALPGVPNGLALLAGYHWFGEWGRDGSIALPGLLITTGRFDYASTALTTFGRHLDRGMLPNDFPNEGPPGYNSVDAPLWYVEAVRLLAATGSPTHDVMVELATVCVAIADGYTQGTRYGIGVDPVDGLLHAGEPGVQLTWMDAKVGDWVVTPRSGKPVEINALWYSALRTLANGLAAFAGRDPGPFAVQADRVAASFKRFDDPDGPGLCDVLDSPNGMDRTLRPNQIFAAALEYSPLPLDRRKEIVGLCARELLSTHGLRSLAPSDPAFVGKYGGDPRSRDGAYHQGTVWPWLIGAFATAHFRAFGDRLAARALLEPLLGELDALCCGTLAEIADGDAPFRFDGAIAQAWSVAEVLRAWHELSE